MTPEKINRTIAEKLMGYEFYYLESTLMCADEHGGNIRFDPYHNDSDALMALDKLCAHPSFGYLEPGITTCVEGWAAYLFKTPVTCEIEARAESHPAAIATAIYKALGGENE